MRTKPFFIPSMKGETEAIICVCRGQWCRQPHSPLVKMLLVRLLKCLGLKEICQYRSPNIIVNRI